MLFSKKINNYKQKATILANDLKDVKNSTKETAISATDAIKKTAKLPWKQLPLQGWLYIIYSAVALILLMIFL